jgi:hypothetical protein
MGVSVPYTILFDQEMNIYCQQRGYCIGNDEILCQQIDNCLAGIKKVK